MKPLISVIINVYNGEKYIETCVKSILAQTYSNFELLIVNDGSTDRTATIANKLEKSYANILRVIHSQNIGLSGSRHLGLTEAKGEYITFVDVDDWVNPNYLQQLYEAIEREEADMSICAYYEEYESGHQEIPLRKPLNTTDFIRDMIHGRTWCVVWNKLFKTSLLKKHGITFEKGIRYWEDVPFSLSYALFCKKIAYVEQPLYHYVKYNMTSLTATEGVNVRYNQDRVKAVRLLEQYLKQSDRTIEFDVDILWLKFWIKDMFITHAMSRERIVLWQTSFPEVNARWKEQYSKKDILHWALVHHYAWILLQNKTYNQTFITKMNNKLITVTSPLLPDINELQDMLKEIWASKWITNMGSFHKQLEKELAEYLKVPYISLFTNGTLPLITALQALRITGEVITTPYSFVATTHSLWWNGIKPVFVDIDPKTGNIDPNKIEMAITPYTTAIMPVHVYGKPCDTKAIQEIADKYGLKIIYDAAHAFGVEVNGESILNAGNMSTLSFHATKVYNTIEGGALVMHDEKMKKRIDYLKNFGFANETTVVAPGINSKIDEVRAAYGILNLRQVDAAIEARHQVAIKYREALRNMEGIRFFDDMPGVRHNYSYFPIFVDAEKYGMTRDELYFKMKEQNILGRRYFYPLISTFTTYRGLESAKPGNLPQAHKMADEVICLPMHHALTEEDIQRILCCIMNK